MKPCSLHRLLAVAALARLPAGRPAGAQGDDAESLVQHSLQSGEGVVIIQDIYVTTAYTLEDFMYFAVLHKTMKHKYHGHTHHVLVRKDSPINKRAHAIRLALGKYWWNVRVEVFNPELLSLTEAESGVGSWRHFAPFQYQSDQFSRIVNLNADMIALKNIDEMTHRPDPFTMARYQGDCKNLTEATSTDKPSTVVLSMIPDSEVTDQITNPPIRLNVEKQVVMERSKRTKAMIEEDAHKPPQEHIMSDKSGVISLAYQQAHPDVPASHFVDGEVMSVSCLIHHKDKALQDRSLLNETGLLYLGDEGRKIIEDILAVPHPETRLTRTIQGMEGAGRTMLAKMVKIWFDAYNSDDVKAILDAAKNGRLAEY